MLKVERNACFIRGVMGSTGRILQDIRCTVGSGNTVVMVTVDAVVINIVSEAYSNYTTFVFGVHIFSLSPRDAPVRGGRVTSLSIGK